MRPTIVRCLAMGALVACVPSARTDVEPIVADRPDFTEDTVVMPAGMVQLEAGVTSTVTPDDRALAIGEGLVRVGMHERAELRIYVNSYTIDKTSTTTERGLEDLIVGTKLAVAKGGGEGSLNPAVSVLLLTSLPTGAAPYRARTLEPTGKLSLKWDITSRISLATNTNYTFNSEDDESFGTFAQSGSLGVELTKALGSYAELFTIVPRNVGGTTSTYLNGGLSYLVNDDLVLDIRGGTSVKRTGDYFFGIGFAHRWR